MSRLSPPRIVGHSLARTATSAGRANAHSRYTLRDRLPAMARAVFAEKLLFLAVGLLLTHIWRFHDLTPQVARLRLAAVFTVSSWIALALAPNWGALRVALRRPYAVAFLLWAAWIIIGVPPALSPDNTWDFIVNTHSKNVLLFLFLLSTLVGLRRLKVALLANVAGAFVVAGFYIKGGMPSWGTPVPMYDVNDLALLLAMTLPLAVWAAVSVGRMRWERVLLWTAALSFVLAITGTGSRGGFLALCTVAGILVFRFRIKRAAKLAFAVGVGVLLISAPEAYWDRMATILDPSEDYNLESDVGRIEIWKRGFQYAQDNPVTGLGAQNFPVAEGTLRPEARAGQQVKWSAAHSSFVQTLAETGFVGFLFWSGMLVTAFGRIRASKRRLASIDPVVGRPVHRMLDTLAVCLVAYCVGGFFLSQAYLPYVLVLLAVLAGLERSVDQLRLAPTRQTRGTSHHDAWPGPRSSTHSARAVHAASST